MGVGHPAIGHSGSRKYTCRTLLTSQLRKPCCRGCAVGDTMCSLADLASVLASQYADDCAPLLAGLQAVPGFLADMEVFRCASGQRLNMTKVELLVLGTRAGVGVVPAGAAGPPWPPGWRVVPTAKSLGVLSGDWMEGTAPPVELWRWWGCWAWLCACRCLCLVGRLRPRRTPWARCSTICGFAGLPSETAVKALLGQVAAVVDRRLSPAKYAAHPHARPVGVSLEIMQLPPVCGGVRLLPLRQHVQARHAGLAVWYVLGACGLLPFVPAHGRRWRRRGCVGATRRPRAHAAAVHVVAG